MKSPIFFFFLFNGLLSFGQSTSIHFDKPYYFAGEYIFYTFCNSDVPDDTLCAQVELISEEDIVISYFLRIINHCGDGYFKLAHQTLAGMYKFKISVFEKGTWQKRNIGVAWLPVYNDESLSHPGVLLDVEPDKNSSTDQNSIPSLGETHLRNQFEVSLAPPEDLKNKINRISVTVRDAELFGSHQNTVYEYAHSQLNQPIRGIPFSGSRKILDTGTIRNHLLFAFNADDMIFDGSVVDLTNDRFNLMLSPFYEEKAITFIDYLGAKIDIEESIGELDADSFPSLKLDSTILQHLKIYGEEKQINRIFQQVNPRLQDDSLPSLKRATPDFFVDVQDYAIRGTIVDLFKELSTSLKFRIAGKGQYEAKLLYERNGITKFYSRPPLFIINNSVTYDGSFISQLPLQEIKNVSIYHDYDHLQHLSPIALGGLIYIEMMDPNYVPPADRTLPQMAIQGLQTPTRYPIISDVKENQPSVGSLLYWNPSVMMHGDEIRLQIPTQDIKNQYLIEAIFHLKDGSIKKISRLFDVGL